MSMGKYTEIIGLYGDVIYCLLNNLIEGLTGKFDEN